ncbi:uncharacterized protein BDZ99DRAFT_532654 [Mytilinidion resinicola]|uniref:CPAF-like PDZ domain-containing protein n=1 Tax=Mytilinidion resinicola TaxID=574789 RepID=A0A6A6YIT4_9PEZI|nr:uncharacterized protein BDZ99DRAFT_532654 [Mytilinidion resinicola]KAF2808700.1 hypothetical protein BDZ99DRAFT_532654 [Mytilinidion resinicola]
MSFAKLLVVSLCLFPFGSAKPLKGTFAPRQDPSSPLLADSTACGDIIVAVNNNYTLFRASWVYECLQSVPFNSAVATRFLDYYNMTLQFQSTTGYLKVPPAGYQRPSFDVNQALEDIKQNVTAGVYKNQYEFEAHLQLLVTQLRDTHVILNAGALSAFSFVSPYGLVSASVDGKQAPEIYLDDDLYRAWAIDGDKASPIAQINGVDVIEYLARFAERNSAGFLEPHADWNAVMDSPALDVQGYLSTFQSATLYPGDDTFGDALNFTLKNGTTIETVWWAFCVDCTDTGPLTTGGDFYNYFVLGFLPDSYEKGAQWWPIWESEASTPSNDSDSDSYLVDILKTYCALGHTSTPNWCIDSFGAYPNNPVVAQANLSIDGGGIVSGYMLDDVFTAVLSIPSFFQSGDDTLEFRQAILDFIGNASQTKASRVVIDLQKNTGGLTFLAYDTFKQFFPNLEPNGASRQRSHELSNILGEAYTAWWDLPETNHSDNYQYAASEWIVTNRINVATGKTFSSWEEFYGPEVNNGDTFSGAQRYNLSDEIFDYAAFRDYPWGYDPRFPLNDTTPNWAAEDIVILTDGLCGSACALFVEFMTHQAGVRTVAVGGQPTNGPMQAVSGTRSAAAYSADALDYDFGEGLEFPVDKPDVASKLPNRTDTGMWTEYAGFTIRNQVRGNDFKPLQFQYQAADCRIYYTLDTVYNMTQLWRYAARAAWDDASLCVEDSTGYPTARNETSTKAPPSPNPKETKAFDFDSLLESPFAGNSTFELTDGPVSVSKGAGQITSCKANGACDSGSCLPMQLSCFGKYIPVYACLPTCDLAKGPLGGCTGAGAYCDPDGILSSKQNGRGASGGTNAIRRTGHCKTTIPSKQVACPR